MLCKAAVSVMSEIGRNVRGPGKTYLPAPEIACCALRIASACFDNGTTCARLILVRCAPDRKSTRLNSSHSSISYAVFCLKKKKKHGEDVDVSCGDNFSCDRSQC